jgi:DNA polymerase-3 subunit epsilon
MDGKNLVVIDTETTGFGKNDKIVEISAITVSASTGEIIDEFDTLINPLRDISNSNIHGITASMVSAAPEFNEISIALGNILHGNILVAHNLSFDSRMISQEFTRTSAQFNAGSGVCTLNLTKSKLVEACRRFDINIDHAHRSLSDARATASLLSHLDISDIDIFPMSFVGLEGHWNPRTLRREHFSSEESGTTVRAKRKLFFPTSNEQEVAYLDLLDFFFEDSKITSEELSDLRSLALESHLDGSRVTELHFDYLMSLYSAAMRDGVLTEQELILINELVRAFELTEFKLPNESVPLETRGLPVGATICFTGSASFNGIELSRERLEAVAAIAGFQPVNSVTKKGCDLVVAADPMSMSGKAKKARSYDIPVIGVSDFVELPEVSEIFVLENEGPDWFKK